MQKQKANVTYVFQSEGLHEAYKLGEDCDDALGEQVVNSLLGPGRYVSEHEGALEEQRVACRRIQVLVLQLLLANLQHVSDD